MRPSHAEICRTLVEQGRLGVLSTLMDDGHPYCSLVQYAADENGQLLLFLSDLAEHTQNLQARPKVSFLVWEESPVGDPLASARATLVGQVQETDDGLPVYLKKHPQAALYQGFKDFNLYRLAVSQVRYVGGFGSMSWVGGKDYRLAEADPIAPLRTGIIEHMNQDHMDAMDLIARHLGGRPSASWKMTGVDRYGYQLESEGQAALRVTFESPVQDSKSVRLALVAQTNQARKQGTP